MTTQNNLDPKPQASLWSRIRDALSALANGEGLAAVFEYLRPRHDHAERSVGFTIAVIALGAKMAKADGLVTRGEVAMFRKIFTIPPEEEAHAGRVFDLARQDVAGFDAYARKIRAMFGEGEEDVLSDLLEALFHIALADGSYHPNEDAFLEEVARIFGLSETRWRAIRARFVEGALRDPYDVLGVDPNASLEEIRQAWRHAVRESHPDRMIARGVPPDLIRLATERLASINAAWEEISAQHA